MPIQVSHLPADDAACGWFHTSSERQPKAAHQGNSSVRFAIIGAGFTGLAAARQLALHFPDDAIALIEAQQIGFGPAGRNAGFAIDLPHDIGAKDYIGDLAIAQKTLELNQLGQSLIKTQVEQYGIDCQLHRCGKYQAAVEAKGVAVLDAYRTGLDKLKQPYEVIEGNNLPSHIGTSFYRKALFTPGTMLVQPAALVKGLANHLPQNVQLYENTAINAVDYGDKVMLMHAKGRITADTLLLTNNAFGMRFGFLQRSMLPMFLYASLTRPLTAAEQKQLGGKEFWGVIPADPFGSTVRRTPCQRILMRNSFSFRPNHLPDAQCLEQFKENHKRSFQRRFPMLPEVDFKYTWSGSLALSHNHKGYFGQLGSNIWASVCHNGLGVTRGTASGKLLADVITGQKHPLIDFLHETSGPSTLPPQPFLSIGVNATLWWGQRKAGLEA